MNIDHRIHEPALPAHLLPSARNAAMLNVTGTPEQIAALKEAMASEKPGEVFITTEDHVHHDIARMMDEGGPDHEKRCGATHPTFTYHGSPVVCEYNEHVGEHYAEAGDDIVKWEDATHVRFVPLTSEEIDDLAMSDDGPHTRNGEVDPRTISPEDMERIKQRRVEINAAMLAQINTEAAETQVDSLPGGVRVPEGYRLAGRVSYDDESTRIEFDDLRAICDIENIAGVTATLTRPQYESKHGYVSLRVIHDHAGVAYLFRKDENTHTHFKVAFGGGAV